MEALYSAPHRVLAEVIGGGRAGHAALRREGTVQPLLPALGL